MSEHCSLVNSDIIKCLRLVIVSFFSKKDIFVISAIVISATHTHVVKFVFIYWEKNTSVNATQ